MKVRHVIGCGVVVLLLSVAGTSAAQGGTSDVADAVMSQDTVELGRLIAQGANVNAVQADGASAIHWASYHDDVAVADQLIRAGADVSVRNRADFTPLALAALNGSRAMIERLLDGGADANETLANGESALMMASRTGDVDSIQLLIDRGADIEATDDLRGTTPLMWAAAEGNAEALQVLMQNGADVSARSGMVASGRRPYLAPTASSRIAGANRGTGQAGASAGRGDDDRDDDRVDAPLSVPDDDADDDADDDDGPQFFGGGRGQAAQKGGMTALIFASRQGDIESARVLLEGGADVNQTSADGWTPLLTATQNRYYELGTYFLERGADPNIATTGNSAGWNPLYIATDNRNIEGGDYPTRKPDLDHLEFIESLLEYGSDPNLRMASSTETRTIFTHQWLYEEGATPFLRAAQSGDIVLMRLLLEHGADPSIPGDDGVTPLMAAAGIGWVEGVTSEWSEAETVGAVNLLLELGADVNAQDEEGRTALMGAAHKGATQVTQILIDNGVRLDTRDFGSRDSINLLEGITWIALDYADGLVRVGVQSSIEHPETASLIRTAMMDAGLEVPAEGRTLDSICITAICQ